MGMRLQSAVLLLVAFVTAPCCGGGGGGGKKGGGGGGGNAYDLGGDFHRVSFSGNNTTDINRVGTSTFTAGAYSETATLNTNGTISAATDSGTYAVSSSGAFTWTDTGPFSFRGGTLFGGSFAVSSSVTAGSFPTVLVDVRKGGGSFTNATLAGTYYVVGYGWSPGGGTPFNYSYTGTMNANGSGAWALNVTGNVDGTIVPGSTNSGTYSIAADGTGTFTDTSAIVAQGGVLASGDIVVTSVMTAGVGCEILVGIRKGGIFNNALLQGPYRAIAFGSSPGIAASHYSLSTDATFDGAGNMTWTATQNAEGAISTIPVISETYVVQADGTLTITNAGVGLTFNGGVLAGGSVAVAACVTAGGFMEIRVYVKI